MGVVGPVHDVSGIVRLDVISADIRSMGGAMEAALITAVDTTRDDEAIALCARADREAFATLYLRQRDAVFRYLRARLASDDDALELTAVTFERALAAMPRYRSQGGGVTAWLLRIARNAAIDHQRRGRRFLSQPRLELRVAPDPSPEEQAIGAEDRRVLRSLLAALSDHQRDAIALRYGAGLTAREIGLVLNKSEASTQKLITRALARLKEQMQ